MVKKMLIDATHNEETRVVVVEGNKIEEYDFETESKKQLKGNIYLASVTRVEPSLQAAFVEYGGNRQGFLAFSEIHPDYYQIPAEDRQQLEQELKQGEVPESDEDEADSDIEDLGGDEEDIQEKTKKTRSYFKRNYKIQEVIKKRQVILIQVLKEERGNKGAALTTYLSIAGRYCVLMPNTSRGGGVSRKITNQQDRKRLKDILDSIDKPDDVGVIIRTAGEGRSKLEIKRDYQYAFNLWDKIRDLTLKSISPALINEESSLIHRSIRDIYNKDIEEVIVTGKEGYKIAKSYMRELTPSHAKKVVQYKDDNIPLFQRYQVEIQISHIYDHQVNLPSGGSIVINQTEALVAIDVNSGRSIKERNIDETAVKTNLEASEEIARQLRLRDMAGLVVIDFIDMENNSSNIQVEKRLKDALRSDRARIKISRISKFGLLEMSRQRLRASLIEATSFACPSCGGSGVIPSTEVASMMVLRNIEEEALRRRSKIIGVNVPTDVGMYLLNNKRRAISDIEKSFEISISITLADYMVAPKYEITRCDENGDLIIIGGGNEHRNENRNEHRNENRNRKNHKKNNDTQNNSMQGDNSHNSNDEEKENDNSHNKNKNRNRRRFNKKFKDNKDLNENSDIKETGIQIADKKEQFNKEEVEKKVVKKKPTKKKSKIKKSSAKKSKPNKSDIDEQT